MTYSTIRSLVIAFIATSLVGVLAACDQTLTKSPEQSVPPDQVFSDISGAQAALNATYSGLQTIGGFGGINNIAADIGANTANFGGSFTTYQAIQAFNMNPSNGVFISIWADHYSFINRANLVIENTPEIENVSQDQVDPLVGQAKFVRALGYFSLVRWFAQPYEPGGENTHPGVILTTSATESAAPNFNQPRSPVDSVYMQIRADLEDAIDRLSPISSPKRAGQVAANALLARVSLYQGQYEEAFQRAQTVIDQSSLELASNPMTPFQNEQNSEIIFAVSFSAIDNTGVNDFITSFYLSSPKGGRGDITPTSDLIASTDTTEDLRYQTGDYEGSTGLYADVGTKWTNKWTDPNLGDDFPVLRVAEMHLIRAEAQARSAMQGGPGTYDEARSHLNEVRNRAGLDDVSSSLSGQDLIDAILQERRLELAFEGKWRHTLQRTGRPITTQQGGTIQPGDTQRIFPIPERAINVNDALTEEDQNQGY